MPCSDRELIVYKRPSSDGITPESCAAVTLICVTMLIALPLESRHCTPVHPLQGPEIVPQLASALLGSDHARLSAFMPLVLSVNALQG